MAKTKVSEWDSTPGNNTDIDSINIAEGCAPSGINNAIRELMSQVKDFQQGTYSDPFNGPVNGTIGATTASSGAFTTLTASSTATLNTLASSGATLTGGSINNMAIGGSTAAAGAFTTLAASGAVTLSGGTANGVAYLNGSKVLTSGSALTFDGTNFGVPRIIQSGSGTYGVFNSSGAGNAWASYQYNGSEIGEIGQGSGIISGGSNTDFGIRATNNLVFGISYNEQMRLTSTGLGIGTSSPAQKLDVVGTIQSQNNAATNDATVGAYNFYNSNASASANPIRASIVAGRENSAWGAYIDFYTSTGTSAQTSKMRIDSSGNVGIGTSSPGQKLEVAGSALFKTGTSDYIYLLSDSGAMEIVRAAGDAYIDLKNSTGEDYDCRIQSVGTGGTLAFSTVGSERARIDSSGNLLVGDTSTLGSARGYINAPSGSNGWTTKVQNNSNVLFNGYNSSGTQIFYVKGDGGIANYSANNTNLSDERTKTDIQEAGGYLSKICAIPVKTFKYKNQEDDELNLGVIAQDVEAVAPELVDVSGFGETPEDGIPLKAIYQTDLQYALMKCIQEQQAIINAQQAALDSLKARLDAANL